MICRLPQTAEELAAELREEPAMNGVDIRPLITLVAAWPDSRPLPPIMV